MQLDRQAMLCYKTEQPPPVIGERMTGAEITLSSSTMANGLPTLAWVASAVYWYVAREAGAPAILVSEKLPDAVPVVVAAVTE